MENRLFIVTDNASDMKDISTSVQKLGYACTSFNSTEECIAHLTHNVDTRPDMIMADADISGLDGFELLRMCQMGDINIPVLVFTGNDTLESASKALQFGAWDYVAKPVTEQRLSVSLENLAERKRLKKEVRRLNKRLSGEVQFKDIIGESHAMKRLLEVLRRACDSDITAFLQGESGVGKEVVARALHCHSSRRGGAMVTVNCSAISQNMIESELFGCLKHTANGVEIRPGRFEEASGGTLFLDEIADLDHTIQVKLLRALQDGEVIPVGSTTPVKVNVRLVVATGRNLRRMVHEGDFREDLFYRINVLPIEVPPLRDRRRDILLLAEYFMESFCTDHDMKPKEFTPAAEKALIEFHWPGNVRQLENAIHRLAVMVDDQKIEKKDLDFLTVESGQVSEGENVYQSGIMLSLEEVEKSHIRRVVMHCKGNMSQAARVLGVSRSTLYRQMDQIKADAVEQDKAS